MTLNVVAKLKIMPVSVETDMEKLAQSISPIVNKVGELKGTEIIPVAFGLNALEAVLLLDDSKGGISEIESKIKKLEGVLEVSVIDLNRL